MIKHKNRFLKNSLAIITACAALTIAAQAQLIEWNINGYTHNGTVPTNIPPTVESYASVAAGASATGFSLVNGAFQSGNQSNAFSARVAINSTTLDVNNLSALPYVSFSITADAGNLLSVGSLTFGLYRAGTTPAHPTTAVWGYRADGGSWVLGDYIDLVAIGTTAPSSSSALQTWNFSDDNVLASTIEFGVWAWGGSTANAPLNIVYGVVDSGFSPGLSVGGSVTAVPEPSTYLMLGFGIGALLLVRKRPLRA